MPWTCFLIGIGLIGLVVFRNERRCQRASLQPSRIVPNCLLTKTPLVFVAGRQSVAYRKAYWNTLPGFLEAHGYTVQVCTSLDFFADKGGHLILDSETYQQLRLQLQPLHCSSLSCLGHDDAKRSPERHSSPLTPEPRFVHKLNCKAKSGGPRARLELVIWFIHRVLSGSRLPSPAALGHALSDRDRKAWEHEVLLHVQELAEAEHCQSLRGRETTHEHQPQWKQKSSLAESSC